MAQDGKQDKTTTKHGPINMVQNQSELMQGVEGEVWKPTCELKWVEHDNLGDFDNAIRHHHLGYVVLKQKFIDNYGKVKWVDVPTETIKY